LRKDFRQDTFTLPSGLEGPADTGKESNRNSKQPEVFLYN
jgi:hypothetical protein